MDNNNQHVQFNQTNLVKGEDNEVVNKSRERSSARAENSTFADNQRLANIMLN